MCDIDTINKQGYYLEQAPLQRSSTRYEVDECLFADKTEFAEIVIVENSDYGRMLFLDHELQSSSYDEAIYHESLVHPLLNAYSNIDDKAILVIGGAEGATVREVLKWSPAVVNKVHWVDIDRKLVDVCYEHLKYCDTRIELDERVSFFSEDIMDFLSSNRKTMYDCIIIDLPDPDPTMKTPLYGAKFWQLINSSLKEYGGIVSHVGPVEPGLGRQVGLKMIQDGLGLVGFPYHTFIPCFQGEWGFWMNKRPSPYDNFPPNCKIMNPGYHSTIFHWDRHWQVMSAGR